MPKEPKNIVVIGGSAGAIEVLGLILHAFPQDMDAAILVATHMNPSVPSLLSAVLARKTSMTVVPAEDQVTPQAGFVYVGQPDRHLTLHEGQIRLGRGPRENGFRPAVDPLFRSAAMNYGKSVIAVVLSGNLDDGTSGLLEVKRQGGITIIQDPDDALYPGMPSSALQEVPDVHYVLPAKAIGETIAGIVSSTRPHSITVAQHVEPDIAIGGDLAVSQEERTQGVPASLGCPDCGGPLWQRTDGEVVRYRCRVGHAFSDEALLAAQTETLETALWTALRALEETREQATTIATRMERRGHPQLADKFRRQAEDADRRAAIVRAAVNHAAGDNGQMQALP